MGATTSISIEVTENGRKAPEWTVESDLTGVQTKQSLVKELQAYLVVVSKEALKEEQAKGFDKYPRIFVDKDPRKRMELVNPFGEIDIIAREEMGEIIFETYRRIQNLSPVRTGNYLQNNLVFVKDVEVASNLVELQNYLKTNPDFKHKDQIRFVNTAPYARKLERQGITAGKKAPRQNKKADKRLGTGKIYFPNGSYVLAKNFTERRYGKNVNVRFAFIDGGQLGLTGAGRTYKTDSGVNSRKGKSYYYPSIVLTVIYAGTK